MKNTGAKRKHFVIACRRELLEIDPRSWVAVENLAFHECHAMAQSLASMPSFFQSLKNSLKERLPESGLKRIRTVKSRLGARMWQWRHPGVARRCPFCGKEYAKFMPYVNRYSISQEADIVSGQSMDSAYCPNCRSSVLERSLYFYIQKNEDLFSGKRILHFAPEKYVFQVISELHPELYVCGDLFPDLYLDVTPAMEKLDILRINYPAEHFDTVICNHVLEHIDEDVSAMKELCRVLKKGGTALLMVPMSAKLTETFEDRSKKTEEERAETFGQFDHVRIYSEKSFLERLRSAGFAVTLENPGLTADEQSLYGINPREKIYVGRRA